MSQIDVEELKSWSGRTEERSDMATPRLLAEFRATLAPFLAPEAIPGCPPGFHWCLVGQDTPMAELGEDGHPKRGGFLPPVPLPRRMWAGGATETLGTILPGDHVIRRSRIGDINVKEGKSGTLCFVAVHNDYVTERGVAVSDRLDVVFREASSGSPAPQAAKPAPAEEKPKADLSWKVEASTPLLFRYSALTFNGHRIHYDYPYATEVEGYAGLLVHGPMQATILFNLAATLIGSVPRLFDYRGVSPIIADGFFTVNGTRNGDGSITCWTEGPDGKTGMKASAR